MVMWHGEGGFWSALCTYVFVDWMAVSDELILLASLLTLGERCPVAFVKDHIVIVLSFVLSRPCSMVTSLDKLLC